MGIDFGALFWGGLAIGVFVGGVLAWALPWFAGACVLLGLLVVLPLALATALHVWLVNAN